MRLNYCEVFTFPALQCNIAKSVCLSTYNNDEFQKGFEHALEYMNISPPLIRSFVVAVALLCSSA